MKLRRIFALVALIFFLSIAVYSSAQDEMRFIDNAVFENPSRSPAVFDHDTHNETAEIDECNTCHHVYEDGKFIEYDSSEDRSCYDCHDLRASGNILSLRNAFHRNCKGCHLENKAGPIMCGECHLKIAE